METKTIQELGLTKQREVVLQVIREAHDHLTANEVFSTAKGLLPSISFATVYNSLRYLKEAGMIAEISFGHGASRFDRMTTRHDHAICPVAESLSTSRWKCPSTSCERRPANRNSNRNHWNSRSAASAPSA
jgi:Fe2+ or Zn2+ uptake regulation protein